MSSFFTRTFDPSRFSALSRAGTILGLSTHEVPPLPLTRADVDLPVPLVLPTMPAIIRPRARALDETRELALALSRDQSRLQGWDRTFVREVVKWRAEPSAFEADEIARLAEQVFWQTSDQASHRHQRGRE